MSNLSLLAARPAEPKEIASLSARFITTLVIGMAGVLSLAPVAAYLAQ